MDEVIAGAAPAGWIEALEESEADIRAGHVVSLEPVLGRMRESIARMEARRVATPKPVATGE